jgi:uncharacterized secreted protein with C-terminal beta-propeller domain
MAVAAAVSLIGGVAAAVVVNHDSGPQFVASPLPTVPGSPSTTEPSIPEVSIPAKLIAQSRLIAFSNCGTFTSYMRNEGLKVVTPYGLPSIGNAFAMRGDVAFATAGGAAERNTAAASDSAKSTPAPAASAPGGGAQLRTTGGDEFSTTNVQEAGIDEPDVIKTDGKRIYALSNGRLFIVAADQPRIVGSVDALNASELFLVGDRAIVFSNGGPTAQPMADGAPPSGRVASGAASSPSGIAPAPNYRQQVRVTVLDVGKPDAIKEVSHLDVDGQYVSARLVNGVARIVISAYTSRLGFSYPADGSPEAQAMALQKNRDVVRSAKFDDWVPHFTVTDAAGKTSAERPTVACGSAYRPPNFSGFGQLSVMSLDPKNPGAAKSTSVAADGQIVYGSGSRLYVATTQWGDVKPMAAGAAMPPDVQPLPKTLIHAFDITDPGQARYTVSGSVRGTVLNQFSLSEHEGNLRVATTDGDQSFVTVMADQSGKILGQIGQVGGLGKGERIYAVRFIGALGYVVTFRQVDPLYVIDLSAPTKPRVVGELKVLGYSAYLHPVSDKLLIGIGQDASAEGRRLGTQVSLFDVSDPAAPKLLQRHALGQGGSQAEYDHHAFLYWAPRQLAVLPIQEYTDNGGPGFMGAVGLKVTSGAITEVGRVTGAAQYDQISRSLVIGNRLFTYSNGGIKASDLGSFAEQGFVAFPQPQQCCVSDGGGGTSGGAPGQVEPAKPSQ